MAIREFLRLGEAFSDLAAWRGLQKYEDFLAPTGAVKVAEVRDRVVLYLPAREGSEGGLYLKVFRKRGANRPWLQLLRGEQPHSLAEHETRRLEWLEAAGFLCPRVVAWGARMKGWSEVDSFLLTSELVGMQALDEWLLDETPDHSKRVLKRSLLLAAARTLANLHRSGFDHTHPYLRHFFVPRNTGDLPPEAISVAVIDVHTARIGRAVSRGNRERALAEIFLSSLKVPLSQSDRVAFLREYLDGEIDQAFLGGLLRRFRQKLRRHPNRYRWAKERVSALPFPSAFRKLAEDR
ncbi:MAG: hypothetical protein HUU16_02960 [Candidatus Omnitrophica bacterium]|nr:hypothetical protein [Candidatus Omnitrophota bacterium]